MTVPQKRFLRISLTILMILIIFCALSGLSALAFFMSERTLVAFAFHNWTFIRLFSASGALIAFLAHIVTWGKASMHMLNRFLNHYLPDHDKKNLSNEKNKVNYPRAYYFIQNILLVIAILGTMVVAASSYLGFLSVASALGVTGNAFFAIKIFGILCCGSMLISSGAFGMYAVIHGMEAIYKRYDRKKSKAKQVPQYRQEETYKNYRKKRFFYKIFFDITAYLFVLFNAVAEVTFKSFAFFHWLMLIGLIFHSPAGITVFTPIGLSLLGSSAIILLIYSLSTEGIFILNIVRQKRKSFLHPIKEKINGYTPHKPEHTDKNKHDFWAKSFGRIVAILMSFITAMPVFTSAISKVAGVTAFVLWFFPGMQGTAALIGLVSGIIFSVSKFIGYYALSGPMIIDSVSNSLEASYSTISRALGRQETVQELTESESDSDDNSDSDSDSKHHHSEEEPQRTESTTPTEKQPGSNGFSTNFSNN